MHDLDRMQSEVTNFIKEYKNLKGYFQSRLETILEANYIFNQFYNKLMLLKNIQKENKTQQLEKIIEIVHKAKTNLP